MQKSENFSQQNLGFSRQIFDLAVCRLQFGTCILTSKNDYDILTSKYLDFDVNHTIQNVEKAQCIIPTLTVICAL